MRPMSNRDSFNASPSASKSAICSPKPAIRRVGLFLATAFCLGLMCVAASAASRFSVASGNWVSTSTWSATSGGASGASAPVAADTVTIEGGFTVTLDAAKSATNVTVKNTSTLDAATFALTVSSTFTLESGSTFKQGGTTISTPGATRVFDNNSTYIFNGSQTGITGGAFTFGNLTWNSSGNATPTIGLTINGNLNILSGQLRASTTTNSRSHTVLGNVVIDGATSILIGSNNSTAGLTGTWNISGNVTIQNSGTLRGTINNGDGVFNIGGNLINNGTVEHGSGTGVFTVNFNGSSAQTVSGNAITTLQNVGVSNASGVSLSTSETLTGTFTLTSGNLTTNANILTLGSLATVSGGSTSSHVIGNLKKTAVPAAFTFPVGGATNYRPVAFAGTSGGGDMTVTNFDGVRSGLDGSKTLGTYWTLASAGSVSANVTWTYVDGDVNGTEANYRVIKIETPSGNATNFPTDANHFVTAGSNTFTVNSLSNFSDWTAGEPQAPTAVKLMNFSAVRQNGEVQLQWQSAYEADNLGYNVYREVAGQDANPANKVRERLTPALIAGSALTVGRTVMTAGQSYTWYDKLSNQQSKVRYWLEDVDINGTRTMHGPFAVASGRFTRSLTKQSATFNELNAGLDQTANGIRLTAGPARLTDTRRHSAMVATSADPNKQRAIAGMSAVKLSVHKDGWYRVSQAELVAAGLDSNVTASQLQLYLNGVQVPINVSGNQNQFTSSDAIEFYGRGLDTPNTDARVYYLIAGAGAGLRINHSQATVDQSPGAQGFDYTVARQEKLIYFAGLNNGDAENFFGRVVNTSPVSQTLTIKNMNSALTTAQGAQLTVALQGLSGQAHQVKVLFNSVEVGTLNFTGHENLVQNLLLSGAPVLEGDNTVQLVAQQPGSDVSLLDSLAITYAHAYTADNNVLNVSANSDAPVRVGGFTSATVRVMDITDPDNPLEVAPVVDVQPDGTFTASVQFQTSVTGNRALAFFADTQTGHPDGVTANAPSQWNDAGNRGNMVIISHRDLLNSVEPLANLRRSQGLTVKVIDVEDLYDEFSYGVHTAQAVHDFLGSAATSWTLKPHYVLLVGDATYDPRNYLAQGFNDLLPARQMYVGLLTTSSDDWLGDFDGDGISDLAIGRLPARTAAETSNMVSKIITYEATPMDPQRAALLVADNGFEGSSSALQPLLPAGMPVQTINRSSGSDSDIHAQIISGINQGPRLVNYSGHGSNGVWTGASILSTPDTATLTNGNRLPLFVMMTCLNGVFQDAYSDSLSEGLMKAQQGGSVAVWASSGMTEPSAQDAINQELYRQLFNGQGATLGDAVRAAKLATGDTDVRMTWTLFGDPAMRMAPATPTAAPASISGTVTTADGQALAGVTVQLAGARTATTVTDTLGAYHFNNMEANNLYTVTPQFANYQFSPASRTFSLVGNKTDAVFTAIPDAVQGTNAIDSSEFFVRQQYRDFLGREPEPGGFDYWTGQINGCNGDTDCLRTRRLDVSAAFFMSREFQESGSYIYRLYQGALGRQLNYAEFSADRPQVIGGPGLDASKTAFANAFVERAEFVQRYGEQTTAEGFVDALLQTAGSDLSSTRGDLINRYNAGGNVNQSRALVVRALADNAAFSSRVYNQSFVLMEYFGYLHRNPDGDGYNFWLNVLDSGDRGNYRGMVCSFITSAEYQRRFGSVVTRSNTECGR